MQVRVYLVGWMKALASAMLTEPVEDRVTTNEEDDDFSEDRQTWPEAGLKGSPGLPLAELRIDLSGAPKDLDGRAQDLLVAIEREVRTLTADWDCSVQVTPRAKD